MRVSAGLATMRATRSLAVDFARAIAGACGFELVVKPRDPRPPGSSNGRQLPEGMRARYVEAYRDFRAGGFCTMKAAAVKHALDYRRWYSWVTDHGPELERELVANPPVRVPITKPGGEIL